MVICAGGPSKLIFREEYPLEDLAKETGRPADFILQKYTVKRESHDTKVGILNILITCTITRIDTVETFTTGYPRKIDIERPCKFVFPGITNKDMLLHCTVEYRAGTLWALTKICWLPCAVHIPVIVPVADIEIDLDDDREDLSDTL